MHFLNLLDQTSLELREIAEVQECRHLREQLRKSYPDVWTLVQRSEQEHWRNFSGFSTALSVLNDNITGPTKLPDDIIQQSKAIIESEDSKHLLKLSQQLGEFFRTLPPYFLNATAQLETHSLRLPSALRRCLLDTKGCFLGSRLLNTARAIIQNYGDSNVKEMKGYEIEMLRRNIAFSISQKGYDLALELGGPSLEGRKASLAIKQLVDSFGIARQLLFQFSLVDVNSTFNTLSIAHTQQSHYQITDHPYGAVIEVQLENVPPLMIPGELMVLEKDSENSWTYIEVLSYEASFKQEAGMNTRTTGIDLEEFGPDLLSRFKNN